MERSNRESRPVVERAHRVEGADGERPLRVDGLGEDAEVPVGVLRRAGGDGVAVLAGVVAHGIDHRLRAIRDPERIEGAGMFPVPHLPLDVFLFLPVFLVGVAAGDGLPDVAGFLGPPVLLQRPAPEPAVLGGLLDVLLVGIDGVGFGAPEDEVLPEHGVVAADRGAGHRRAFPRLLARGGVEEAGE